MRLKELLHIIEKIVKGNKLSTVFICGGLVRDKVLGRLDHISDLDLTTGDKTIEYVSKELSMTLGAQYDIKTKMMNDGHSSIFAGDLKIDFSSNFNVPGIEKILTEKGIKNPINMQKELFSRDFTCNALLMGLDLKTITDPTGLGLKDIKEKKIRTCLKPEITLTSNKNRVVRAIYLAAKLGFEVDEEIIKWVRENPDAIKIASAHTLTEKLNEAFEYDADKAARLIGEMGLWQEIPISEKIYPHFKANQSKTAMKRVAEIEDLETDFETYKRKLEYTLSHHPDNIIEFIKEYHDFIIKDQVDINGVVKAVYSLTNAYGSNDQDAAEEFLDAFNEIKNINAELYNKMVEVVRKYAKAGSLFGVRFSIYIEDLLTPQIIKDLLRRRLEILGKVLEEANIAVAEGKKEKHAVEPQIRSWMFEVEQFLKSKTLDEQSKKAIMRIFRQVNPDMFSTITYTDNRDKGSKHFWDKEQYNIDDVIYALHKIFRPFGLEGSGFSYQHLKKVIEQSNQSAKNLLRRVIFTTHNKPFILDEAMEPMDENYKKTNIGDGEIITAMSEEDFKRIYSKERVSKFEQLLNDFHIIPYWRSNQ